MIEKFELPPRQEGESSPSRKALADYLAMGEHRSLSELAEIYSYRKDTGDRPPTKKLSTLKAWSRKFNWQSTAADYDEYQEWAFQEQQCEANRQKYAEQLLEFQRSHLGLGRSAWKSIGLAIKEVNEFLAIAVDEDGNPQKRIQTLDDCVKVASIVRSLAPISELWGKALAVDSLLESMERRGARIVHGGD
jgi:hypothetical protein